MKKLTLLVVILIFVLISQSQSQFINTVVSIGGEVYNAITKKPISVNVEIYDANNTRVNRSKSNSLDGRYFLTSLKPGNNYEIRVAELEYMRIAVPISVPNTDKYLELSKDFVLIPKKVGTEIPINVKLFENNKSNLKSGAEIFLNDYVNLLKLNPTVKVRIVSYPDSPTDPNKNAKLTQERSESIRNFLINNGIEPDRLKAESTTNIDPNNPIPSGKASKGKKYVGLSYLIIDAT